MIASLNRISTDSQGESKITLLVPSSQLPEVVKLNLFFEKLLDVKITISQQEFEESSNYIND